MALARINPGRACWGRFVPQVEALENRWCPSGIAVNVLPHTLIVQGDDAANTITITDDGQGNISASVTSGTQTVSGNGSGINAVVVFSRGGNDNLNYHLTGALTNNEAIAVIMGSGADSANFDFSAGVSSKALTVTLVGTGSENVVAGFGAVTGANVVLTEYLGAGGGTSALAFTGTVSGSTVVASVVGSVGGTAVAASFKDINNSTVALPAYLGVGGDMFDLTLGGNILGTSQVSVAAIGGAGNDTLAVHATGVNIDSGAGLNVYLNGGLFGHDTASVDYEGQLNGRLTVVSAAGLQGDTLTDNLTADAGSTGRLFAVEAGGPGDDNLTLNVFDNSNPGGGSTLARLFALINGGGGHNTIQHTPNVIVIFP
jgi:hypothetical protein